MKKIIIYGLAMYFSGVGMGIYCGLAVKAKLDVVPTHPIIGFGAKCPELDNEREWSTTDPWWSREHGI